jgi:hypothetical protein
VENFNKKAPISGYLGLENIKNYQGIRLAVKKTQLIENTLLLIVMLRDIDVLVYPQIMVKLRCILCKEKAECHSLVFFHDKDLTPTIKKNLFGKYQTFSI